VAALVAATALLALPGCGVVRVAADPARYEVAAVIAPDAPAPQWPTLRPPWFPPTLSGDSDIVRLERLGAFGAGELVEVVPGKMARASLRESGARTILFRSQPGGMNVLRYRPVGRFKADGPGDEGQAVLRDFVPPVPVRVQGPAEGALRGVVVYLTGIAGVTPQEQRLTDELRGRGWLVVIVPPPLMRGVLVEIEADDRELIARRIAELIDEQLSLRACAVEAVLAWLAETAPGAPSRPLVLAGGSAGAIELPAVAARLGDRVDAAVLIGGGADFMRIVIASPAGRSLVRFHRDGRRLDARELRELAPDILARATLDPFWAAAALSDTPVLMLHARYDEIVPAAAGELLYERLARPERWSFPMGHTMLFLRLPSEARAIADWVEAATSGPSTFVPERTRESAGPSFGTKRPPCVRKVIARVVQIDPSGASLRPVETHASLAEPSAHASELP
jgi:fermentation-respiration switch protein FrsA (DUF1100 family)